MYARSMSWAEAFGAYFHRWLEDTLALLVAEASVDHVIGEGGQTLRHGCILSGRLGEIPSVQQLVGAGDP